MVTVLDSKNPTKIKIGENLVEGAEIRALLYEASDASTFSGVNPIINTGNRGYVECAVGTCAWTDKFETMKQFTSTGWV